MPARRRRPSPTIHPLTSPPTSAAPPPPGKDPAAMFAAALRESETRKQVAHDRARAEQAHASAIEAARGDVERAVEAIRSAKRAGTSAVAADGAWRAAKARLIELETGTAPSWAPAAEDGVPDENSGDEPSEPSHHETA